MQLPLPCLICGKTLENAFPPRDSLITSSPEVNQPYDATTFHTTGHYGSSLFDPMNGDELELNICDSCLAKPIYHNRIAFVKKQPVKQTYIYKQWENEG